MCNGNSYRQLVDMRDINDYQLYSRGSLTKHSLDQGIVKQYKRISHNVQEKEGIFDKNINAQPMGAVGVDIEGE